MKKQKSFLALLGMCVLALVLNFTNVIPTYGAQQDAVTRLECAAAGVKTPAYKELIPGSRTVTSSDGKVDINGSVNWLEKQANGSWQTVSGKTFEGGKTYRLKFAAEELRLRIVSAFGDKVPTVTINGIEVGLVNADGISDSMYKASTTIDAKAILYSKAFEIKVPEYKISVENGRAFDLNVPAKNITSAVEGADIGIEANAAPQGQIFDKWEVVSNNVTIGESDSEASSFTMPAAGVELRAVYKAEPLQEHKISVIGGKAFKLGDEQTPIDKAFKDTDIKIMADLAEEGKAFEKWEILKGTIELADINEEFSGFVMPDMDVEVKAVYKDVELPPVPTAAISFDLAGGTLDGRTGILTHIAKIGDVMTLPEAPTKEGYTFAYWKGSKYKAGASYVVKGDHTFTAQWEENPKPNQPQTPENKNDNEKNQNNQNIQKDDKKPKSNVPNKTDKKIEPKTDKKDTITKKTSSKAKNKINTSTKSKIKKVAPKTGDTSSYILWMSVMVVSLVALVTFIARKKRA